MVQPRHRALRVGGCDGHGETVHAEDPRDPSSEAGSGAEPPGGGAEPGRERRQRGQGARGGGNRRASPGRKARELGEDVLESRLYGSPSGRGRPLPDYAQVHRELRRPSVTLQLLHLEYLEQHPDGYRYTQFCEFYRRWRKRQQRTMRQVHRAGEKLFVDYSGKKPHIVDPETGECIEVELFVARARRLAPTPTPRRR